VYVTCGLIPGGEIRIRDLRAVGNGDHSDSTKIIPYGKIAARSEARTSIHLNAPGNDKRRE